MKKFLKVMVTLSLCGFISTSISACAQAKDDPKPNPGPSIETPVKPTPDVPTTPVLDTKAYDDFVASLSAKQNYTYSITENGAKDIYQIDGTTVRFRENGDRRGIYSYEESNQTFKLEYDAEDMYYHKTKAEKVDVNAIVYSDLLNAKLTAYNEDTNAFTATFRNAQYSVVVSDDSLELVNGDVSYTVSEVGTTTFSLPDERLIVDDTDKEPVGPEKPDPEKPVVGEDKIYAVDANGNRVYNTKLLAETLKTALNTTKEGQNQNLYASITSGAAASADDVKFVSTSGDSIVLGVVASSISGAKIFDIISISKSAVESLSSDKQAWIGGIAADNIDRPYSTIVIKQQSFDEEYQESLKTAFAKVANKLAVYGSQPYGINTRTEPMTEIGNAEVLVAFESNIVPTGSSGYDMGNIDFVGLSGIVLNKETGDVYFVSTELVTTMSSTKTPIETIITGTEQNFLARKASQPISVDKEFYKTEEKEISIVKDEGRCK